MNKQSDENLTQVMNTRQADIQVMRGKRTGLKTGLKQVEESEEEEELPEREPNAALQTESASFFVNLLNSVSEPTDLETTRDPTARISLDDANYICERFRRSLARRAKEKSRQEMFATIKSVYPDIEVLQGLIHICCICKKIRADEGDWYQLEEYLEKHSEAEFSHGICHECRKEHYGR